MEFFRSMNISATGIEASRLRMETASLNLANAESSSADPATVFRPKRVKLGEAYDEFRDQFRNVLKTRGVQAQVLDQPESAPIALHDPTHPDANEDGIVLYPNVDMTTEMAEMLAARRAYEAGLAAYTQSREIFISTLEIVRG